MKDEPWRALCERAEIEQDPKILLFLVAEINRLLDEREDKLKTEPIVAA